jgi:hypothetical protein
MTISGENGKVVINMSSRHFIPTTIVSGFPAIGKSFIAARFPIAARDLESSDYHWKKEPSGIWLLDSDGNKIPNDIWPTNYIQDIKALEHSGMYRVVLVSSHELIRKEMAKAGIRYTNLFPENTPEMKKIILDRCRMRQSPLEFINNMDEHWDEYIESLKSDKGAVAKIPLNPESITMWQTWMMMM